MAYSRLVLLLLIGTISFHIPEVLGSPIDIGIMQESIEMPNGDAKCDTLASPVRLPFVGMNLIEWTEKTLQHKFAEVVGDLQVFQDAALEAIKNATSQCQILVLENLEWRIRNYLTFFNSLQIENDTVAPSPSARPHSSIETNKLSKLLKLYGQLLKGKVRNLAAAATLCVKKHSTTNTIGC